MTKLGDIASVPPLDPLDLSQEAARWDDQGGVYMAMREHPQRVWFNGYGEALQWCAKRVRAALRAAAVSPQPSDETILKAISTFENGCDFTLRFAAEGRVFIRFGCYGVHVNLAQGARRALMEWLDPKKGGERELIGLRPETILELKSRKPCSRCGGFTFEAADRAGIAPPQATQEK